MAPKTILIVGCGIAGSTLASFLQLADISGPQKPRITILERASKGKAHLRGQNIDIRGVGVTIIRKLGLEDRIRASTTGEHGVQVVDERNRIWAQNEVEKQGRFQSPTSDIEILRGRLAELCWENSRRISDEAEQDGAAPIEYIFGDYLDLIDQDGRRVHVRFANSREEREFDLVVGADGMQSLTRKMVWGQEADKRRLKSLQMYAGFFSIPREEFDDKWRRWFHAPGGRGIMLRPDDQGLRSTVFMYVVNEKDHRFAQLATKEHGGIDAQKALLGEYYKDAGWKCERIIREMKVTDDFYYDAISQVKMESWTKGRVVLLGDAGYCASPISGMGTTLAFIGSYKLAGLLQDWIKSDENADPTAAFENYNEQMKPIVRDAQKLAPGQVRIMAPQTVWGVWFLRIFAWSVSHVSFIFILLGKLFNLGPQAADYIPVEEFGFRDMSPWKI